MRILRGRWLAEAAVRGVHEPTGDHGGRVPLGEPPHPPPPRVGPPWGHSWGVVGNPACGVHQQLTRQREMVDNRNGGERAPTTGGGEFVTRQFPSDAPTEQRSDADP